MEELTEVPLSNREVLKVLKARNVNEEKHHSRTLEMIEYLELIEKGPYLYPLETLRSLKNNIDLEADLTTLTIISNISDLSLLQKSDRLKIEKYFKESKRN